jgi:hypothetical protein
VGRGIGLLSGKDWKRWVLRVLMLVFRRGLLELGMTGGRFGVEGCGEELMGMGGGEMRPVGVFGDHLFRDVSFRIIVYNGKWGMSEN